MTVLNGKVGSGVPDKEWVWSFEHSHRSKEQVPILLGFCFLELVVHCAS